jgi:hypothetical protein
MDRPPGGQLPGMWLSILIVIGIVGGIAAALAGIGPVAIILIVLGLIALAVRVFGGAAGGGSTQQATGKTMSSTGGLEGGETPQDDVTLGKAHAKTGYAHTGQAHMTPDQERSSS